MSETREEAMAAEAKLGMMVALCKRKLDYEDVIKNLPAGDAKLDGLRYVVADLGRWIERLGKK